MLRVSQPGDRYEREAEAVAHRVTRLAGAPVVAAPDPQRLPAIQRLAPDRDPSLDDITVDEEDQEPRPVQTLREGGRPAGRPAVLGTLLDRAPAGAPLDAGTRGLMESQFGADFSRVRIHADQPAADLSRSLGARAFTHGPDIYFGPNEYRPATSAGRHVLAHELTHVVQQGAAHSRLVAWPRSAGRASADAPAMVQPLRAAGTATKHNVYPWGKPGPVGSNYDVSTDAGSTVPGWMGYLVQPDPLLYWCHGHSLGSNEQFGYSVYSGAPMATVVRDEWTNIPADQTRAGDIAVWTTRFDHSAKFTAPVVSNGALDPASSQLSTKNGQSPLTTMSLAGIAGTYGTDGIAVFRRRA